mgnify:CR=1 FL=1
MGAVLTTTMLGDLLHGADPLDPVVLGLAVAMLLVIYGAITMRSLIHSPDGR